MLGKTATFLFSRDFPHVKIIRTKHEAPREVMKMKRMKRWLGIMLSVMLAAGSLQVPVYAAETGETAVEAAVEEESIENEDGSEDEEPEEVPVEESAEESTGDIDSADEDVREELEDKTIDDVEMVKTTPDQAEYDDQRSAEAGDIEQDVNAEDALQDSDVDAPTNNEDSEIIDNAAAEIATDKAYAIDYSDAMGAIWLNDIVPAEASGYYYYDEQVRKIERSEYSCAVEFDASYNTSAKFDLYKLYDGFSGTVCTGTSTGSGVFTISIYGDGELLKEIPNVSHDNNYLSFNVDVSGVEELEIRSENSGSWGNGWVYIADGLLIKNQDDNGIPDLERQGHVYRVITHTASFEQAEEECEAMGGHLATIMSAEENKAITQYLWTFYWGGSYMIGLYDAAGPDGQWDTWVTGDPVTYSNWGSGQPDWEGQTICAINTEANTSYGWDVGEWDNGWDGDYHYICEWDDLDPSNRIFMPVDPVSFQNKSFYFRSALSDDDSIEYTFDYDDNWVFSNDLNDRYKLMKTSIRVAMAAFGAKEDKGYGPTNIKKMMNTMGFEYTDSSIDYPAPTEENENTIGSAIGLKNIKMADGNTKSIILVTVRGGGYGAEWGGNFHVGDGALLSTGFRTAATQVEGRLYEFYTKYKKYISDDLRIWVTGYSRAAATANLVAAHLIEGKIHDGQYKLEDVSSNEVMAFCFECPNTTTAKNATNSQYDSIINIVNPNDFVPKVPLIKWEFKKYGKTYYMPCEETTGDYIDYYRLMFVYYKDIFDRNSIEYNSDVSLEKHGQASLLEDYFGYIGWWISRTKYAESYEDRVVDIAGSCLGKQGEADWGKAIPQLLSLFGMASIRSFTTGRVINLFTEGDPAPAPNAHYAEKCLSWIDSLNKFDNAKNILTRKFHVNCPVNITIRDCNGDVVGIIENEEVKEIEGGIVARIDEDGQKIFYLPQDEVYTIDIKSTDDGQVNYTIEEYNFDSQCTEKVINYKSIEVKAGDELLGTATEIPEGDEAEYTLKRAEDLAEITPDDVLTGDEVVEYAVEVVSSGNGTVTGGGPYITGEFALVKATPEEGYVFEGWYSGDKRVSNEAEYRFAVEADTVLTAVFTTVVDSISIENTVISGISNKQYTGSPAEQNIIVKYDGIQLSEGADYKVEYSDNIKPGTATVTITGIGSYTGSVTKTFLILPGKTTRGDMFNLANNVKVTWKEVPGAKYYKIYREGITDKKESRKEPVIVTERLIGWDSQPGLTNGHAYRYKIVASLTGKGDSSGDSTLSYSKVMYRLKTVVIRSVKNTAPGKVIIKYDKTTSGDSYVLQYCEREDMVGAKTKVVLGANNTSYTIGGLKKGKTYYISIRVRKKVNGIDYYTTFGVPKKIKIEK